MRRNPTALDLNGPGHSPTEVELYLEKYGTRGLTLLISSFIAGAPDFPGGLALAAELGTATAMLDSALEELADSIPSLNPKPKCSACGSELVLACEPCSLAEERARRING